MLLGRGKWYLWQIVNCGVGLLGSENCCERGSGWLDIWYLVFHAHGLFSQIIWESGCQCYVGENLEGQQLLGTHMPPVPPSAASGTELSVPVQLFQKAQAYKYFC